MGPTHLYTTQRRLLRFTLRLYVRKGPYLRHVTVYLYISVSSERRVFPTTERTRQSAHTKHAPRETVSLNVYEKPQEALARVKTRTFYSHPPSLPTHRTPHSCSRWTSPVPVAQGAI